jgi:hypothetical protein
VPKSHDSQDSRDSQVTSIPVLTEVLASGSPTYVRRTGSAVAPPDASADADIPVLEDTLEVPGAKPAPAGHVHTPDADIPVLEDVFEAPKPTQAKHESAPDADFPVLEDSFETPAHEHHAHAPADEFPVLEDSFETQAHARHEHAPEEVPAPAVVATTAAEPAGVHDVPEMRDTSETTPHAVAPKPSPDATAAHEAHTAEVSPAETLKEAASEKAAPPASDTAEIPPTPFTTPHLPASSAAHDPVPPLDADIIAEHLRDSLKSYLKGAGREVVEERCRAAMQVHATWLVGQIANEVSQVLEAKMTDWVREAVKEENARRSGGG